MNTDIIVGIIAIVCGLSFLTWFTLWSRNVINRIARRRNPPLRDILEDLHHGG